MSSVEFNIFSKILPKASRGYALYASNFLGIDFVCGVREAAEQLRLAVDKKHHREDEDYEYDVDEEESKKPEDTREEKVKEQKEEPVEHSEDVRAHFIKDIKDMVERVKIPKAKEDVKTALGAEKKKNPELDTVAIANDIKQHYSMKDNNAEKEALDIAKKYGLSTYKESGFKSSSEAIKNLLNWMRAINGAFDGAIANAIVIQTKKYRDNLRGNPASDFENLIVAEYFMKKKSIESSLERAYHVGSFIDTLRKAVSGYAQVAHRELLGGATRRTQKTTLDEEVGGSEGEDSTTHKEMITEESIGRIKELNLDDIEVKELITNIKKFVSQKKPEDAKGFDLLIDQLISDKNWNDQASNLLDDPKLPAHTPEEKLAFAKKLLDASPRFDHRKLEGLTPQQKEERTIIYAADYLNKTLIPHLRVEITRFFKQYGSPEIQNVLKKLVNEMRDNWSKRNSLEIVKDIQGPVYELKEETVEEHDPDAPEGTAPTKKVVKKWKKTGSLSARLLSRVASVDVSDVKLVGYIDRFATSEEPGYIKVFEYGKPEFSHNIAFVFDENSKVAFITPDDIDVDHVQKVMKVSERIFEEESSLFSSL
jgi:hypothetical protein